MKRIIVLLMCVVLAMLCCSCGFFGDQRYVCDVKEVDSVQIVKLDKYIEKEYRYEYTVLSQISDHVTFVDQLNKLEQSVNWGDPLPLYPEYVVIKINYRNGNYDMIHQDAQVFFKRFDHNQSGYFFFDDEQFHSLISEYIKE